VLFEREYVEAEQKAYNETAVEDDTICLRMHQGRKSLHQRGIDEQGRTSRPPKTACCTSMSFCGAISIRISNSQKMGAIWMLVAGFLFGCMGVRQARRGAFLAF